ncbi:MAG: N-acetylmuramoyl-L-alanine amidase [Prosthecobacter sp.]|uniref:N-acetylmuramoyl-L-alanine amidase n=1 Tax=Prosthecobacter sp. TaxID=1965333 RepID=UPI0039023E65
MILQRLTKLLSETPRPNNVQPTLLILHATAGASARSSIEYLRSKGNAYHFIIARDTKDSDWTHKSDGTECTVFQCVRYHHRGRHVSTTIPVPGTNGGHINDHSIAISLANLQAHVPNDPKAGPEEYTAQQMLALNELIVLVKNEVPSLTRLTTHAVVQPWNRGDPARIDGPALAARHGLTWWQPTAAEIKKHKPKK